MADSNLLFKFAHDDENGIRRVYWIDKKGRVEGTGISENCIIYNCYTQRAGEEILRATKTLKSCFRWYLTSNIQTHVIFRWLDRLFGPKAN